MFKKKAKNSNENIKTEELKKKKSGSTRPKKSLFSGSKSFGKGAKPLYKQKGNKFVAIDLGNYAIKFAVGSFSGGRVKVDKLFRERLPENLYNDGAISDERRMIDLIRGELSKRSIKDVDMIVSFESTLIIKRKLTIPVLNEIETKELISFELGEYLGINSDDYIIQYKILKEYQKDGPKRDIQLDAVPKVIAKKIFDLLKNAKYNPCILGLQSNFLEKMCTKNKINGDMDLASQTFAVVDIGNSGMVINIFEKGENVFNRIIKSTESIRHSLMMELGIDDVASRNLINEFMYKDLLSAGVSADSNEASGYKAVKDCVDNWSSEIDRVLEYYRSRSVDNKIDKLYIYGGETMIQGLDEYIGKRITIPTQTVHSFSNVDFAKEINISEIPLYVNPISALIRA
ncbi:MAG: pilus assembly protein PilM [Peptostreptococcaceae bacterium]|nr:pilus assembly protein PilM [Peptostreptococcaceae bacterium]